MNQQGRRALGIALGVTLAIVVTIGRVDFVRDDGSDAMESGTPIDVATQSRTPIEVASLGPQIGEQVPPVSVPLSFTLDLDLLDRQRANR